MAGANRLNEAGKVDKVTVRLPVELNDWLDDLVKASRRQNGKKISKEIWVRAALELLRSLPVDWQAIEDKDALCKLVEEMRDEG